MTKLLMGAAGVLIASSVFFTTESDSEFQGMPEELMVGKHVIYFSTDKNCKTCAAFETDGNEDKLRKKVEAKGVKFTRQTAEDRINLKHKDVYGKYTPAFRTASKMAGMVTVPTFAYVVDGEVVVADFGSTKSVLAALPDK